MKTIGHILTAATFALIVSKLFGLQISWFVVLLPSLAPLFLIALIFAYYAIRNLYKTWKVRRNLPR
jgi:hypothetical protein